MTPTKKRVSPYDSILTRAVLHVTELFDYWRIPYRVVSKRWIFFQCPWRVDRDIGSAEFDLLTEKGADWAYARQGKITDKDVQEVFGPGFTKDDISYDEDKFDLIGICLRYYGLDNSKDYALASRLLARDLDALGAPDSKAMITAAQVERAKKLEEYNNRKTKYVLDTERDWEKLLPLHNEHANLLCAAGTIYIEQARGIPIPQWNFDDDNLVRLLPSVEYKGERTGKRKFFPCIIFKISDKPNKDGGKYKGVYRLYIAPNGKGKAPVEHPKKPLLRGDASKKGLGIWFGTPCEKLYVCEGPEDALDLRYNGGCQFVCCALDAGNLHTLKIPKYVREVIICADSDGNGLAGAKQAKQEYTSQGKAVKVIIPSGAGDWNDHHYTSTELEKLEASSN